MGEARRVSGPLSTLTWVGVLAAVGGASGCATTAAVAPSSPPVVAVPTPRVTTVVALPPLLGFGSITDQRRIGRRLGDVLIEATGGHAILDEELPQTPRLDPASLADGIRALGEDPARTVTFSVTAARDQRVEALQLAGARGSARALRRYLDYTVRIEVRRIDAPAVIGRVEAYSSAFANTPEIDAAGRPQGLQVAIESAVKQALRTYAPGLVPTEPFPALLEAPPANGHDRRGGVRAAVDRLKKIGALYPEASADDLAALASSRARFFVVRPGRLAALGVQRGDLVSGRGGKPLGSRAAFARTLARGAIPEMSINRRGGHFLIGQTVVAR